MRLALYLRTCLCVLSFFAAFLLSGCAIFSPIGNAISQGYENTVSYFNGYYNAKRLFTEAEDEILAAEEKERDTTAATATQIPPTAKQKLAQVIDKCSNILAFHSTSVLVDDALLLIGKSFFYQKEYTKAGRKFAELVAQYPNSPLVLETQLWYARAEQMLGRIDESILLGQALLGTARAKKDRNIEIQTHRFLGDLYRESAQTDKALEEYQKVVSSASDNEMKANAQIECGNVYFAAGQHAKAAEAYLRVGQYTNDIYRNFYCKIRAGIAYRQNGEYQKGLDLINAMIADFHFKDYRSNLYYERANLYDANGRRDDAIAEYYFVDTSYAKTEYGVRAAQELGRLYEKELGDYSAAYKYYSEVNASTLAAASKEGRRKYNALSRYFAAWRKMTVSDSLLAVLRDTTRQFSEDTLVVLKDTASRQEAVPLATRDEQASRHKRAIDTPTVALKDTANMKAPQAAVRQSLPSADSLAVLKSLAAQELGDVFYDELDVPDSAFCWYNQSLALKDDTARSPRILYILAELSRTHPDKNFPSPKEYCKRLTHNYPESIYADEARAMLGERRFRRADSAAHYYAEAEQQIEAKEYDKAIGTLQAIAQSFPNSPVCAKSEFAEGWVYENYLGQPDSALAQYKRVAKKYAGTRYGIAATRRFSETAQQDTVKRDTTGIMEKAVKPAIPSEKEEKEKDRRFIDPSKDILDRKVTE
jgi:tetratricopeptide (TPR) repeat protein